MKKLKDNTPQKASHEEIKRVESYPRKLICERCKSELEYDESDLRIGALGCVYVDCPCCGKANALDGNEHEVVLTKDNIEFPTHFHHTSVAGGAVDICNNTEIRSCIQSAIKYFRENKDEFVWYREGGNLFVVVFRYDGDECYEVKLSNDFYSTFIPFEYEDYKK